MTRGRGENNSPTEAVFAIGHSQSGRSTLIGQICREEDGKHPAVGDSHGESVTTTFKPWKTAVGTVVECPGIDRTQQHMSPEEFTEAMAVVIRTCEIASLKFMMFESLADDAMRLRQTLSFLKKSCGDEILRGVLVIASKSDLCKVRERRLSAIRKAMTEAKLSELVVWSSTAASETEVSNELLEALDRVHSVPVEQIRCLSPSPLIVDPVRSVIDLCIDDALCVSHWIRTLKFTIPHASKHLVVRCGPTPEITITLPTLNGVYAQGAAIIDRRRLSEWPSEGNIVVALISSEVKIQFGDGMWELDPGSFEVQGDNQLLSFRRSTNIETYRLQVPTPCSRSSLIEDASNVASPTIDVNHEGCTHASSQASGQSETCASESWCLVDSCSSCASSVADVEPARKVARHQARSLASAPAAIGRRFLKGYSCQKRKRTQRAAPSVASAPARSTWPQCFTPNTLFELLLSEVSHDPGVDTARINTQPIHARDVKRGQKLKSPCDDGFAVVKNVVFHQQRECDLVEIVFDGGCSITVSGDHRLPVGDLAQQASITALECYSRFQSSSELPERIVCVRHHPRALTSLVELFLDEDKPVFALTRAPMIPMLGSRHRSMDIPPGMVCVRMKDNRGDEPVAYFVEATYSYLEWPTDRITHHKQHSVFIPEGDVGAVRDNMEEAMCATRSKIGPSLGRRAPRLRFDFRDDSKCHHLNR